MITDARKIYNKRYYAENKERIKSQTKQYRKLNHDQIKEQTKKHYWLNPELFRAKALEWGRNNKERVKARNRAYYIANKSKIKEDTKRWRQANGARVQEINRAYRVANPERARKWCQSSWEERRPYRVAYDALRRAREINSTVDVEAAKWFYMVVKNQDILTCVYCRRQISAKEMAVDHIVPLTKGGLHHPDNFCISCGSCNSSKSNKLLSEWKFCPPHIRMLAA